MKSPQSNQLVDTVRNICKDILRRVPMKLELATTKYGDRSFDQIFEREMTCYQGLLQLIHTSLNNIMQTIQGFAIADEHFEKTFMEITNNTVPLIWRKQSFSTVKRLSSYIDDVAGRIPYFQKWAKSGTPNVIWFSAFYFPQGFIAVMKQNFAKRKNLDVNDVLIEAEVTDFDCGESDEFITFIKVLNAR